MTTHIYLLSCNTLLLFHVLYNDVFLYFIIIFGIVTNYFLFIPPGRFPVKNRRVFYYQRKINVKKSHDVNLSLNPSLPKFPCRHYNYFIFLSCSWLSQGNQEPLETLWLASYPISKRNIKGVKLNYNTPKTRSIPRGHLFLHGISIGWSIKLCIIFLNCFIFHFL